MADLARTFPAPFDVTKTLAALTQAACDTIDDDRTFAFLVRVSQDSNVKLREVAAGIVTETRARSRPPQQGSA